MPSVVTRGSLLPRKALYPAPGVPSYPRGPFLPFLPRVGSPMEVPRMPSLILPTVNGKLTPKALNREQRRGLLRGMVLLELPLSRAPFVPTRKERVWFAWKALAYRLNGGWV